MICFFLMILQLGEAWLEIFLPHHGATYLQLAHSWARLEAQEGFTHMSDASGLLHMSSPHGQLGHPYGLVVSV